MPTIKQWYSRGTIFILCLVYSILSGFSQSVGINATGSAPNSVAGLDVDFPSKGVLIPRVALTSTTSFAPLASHVAGMLIYNTAATGDVTPGFYYNDGTKWIAGIPSGNSTGDMLYWTGTTWARIPTGTAGQFLQMGANGVPFWSGASFASLTTTAASLITATTASTGANITADGGSAILTRGVCYATTSGPTTANSILTASPATGTGTFTSNLTGLTRATTYYVRAYATNNSLTTYGNEVSFTTLPLAPTVSTTTAASSVGPTSAVSGGNVTNDGGATLAERGVCYATTSTPTIANSKVIDPAPGVGTFVSNISGLTANTLYYVRAYATNSVGTSYAGQISFTSLASVTTASITNVTPTTASGGGTVTSTGTVTARGVCWSTSTGPTVALTTKTNDGTATGAYVSNITGLTANTLYYVRAYATNAGGTVYGTELTFTTLAPTAPFIASTTAITSITSTSAASGGAITSDGGSAITAKGVCWSTSPNPVLGAGNFTSNGTGTTTFTSSITGLTPNTTYYVRAYATNAIGTGYGPSDVVFTTCATPIYTIGQALQGGIVVFVDCTGQHGLIAATVDQGTAAWGCSTVLVGTTQTYGTGRTNTTAILAACATRPIAASLASSYTGGGYSDWFLPSGAELQYVMAQWSVLGLTNVATYLSSSENGVNNVSAYYVNAGTVYSSAAVKTYATNVRAVRYF